MRNDTNITKISFKIFKNYSFINDALSKYYDTKINPKYQEQYAKAVNKEKSKRKKFTKQEYISIKILQDAVDIYITTFDKSDENTSLHQGYSVTCISDYFKNNFILKNLMKTIKNLTSYQILWQNTVA